jgi:shikimate kinase
MSAKPSIALIGLRGAGKTAVGRELARLCGLPHVDTDDLIVQETGRSITDIFTADGEPAFRKLEVAAVRGAVARSPAVISVGGGAVVNADNVAALRQVATIVWLTAPVEILWQRIQGDATTTRSRPPLTTRDGMEELRETLAAREQAYRDAADLSVDTQRGSPQQLARRIIDQLGDMKRR